MLFNPFFFFNCGTCSLVTKSHQILFRNFLANTDNVYLLVLFHISLSFSFLFLKIDVF